MASKNRVTIILDDVLPEGLSPQEFVRRARANEAGLSTQINQAVANIASVVENELGFVGAVGRPPLPRWKKTLRARRDGFDPEEWVVIDETRQVLANRDGFLATYGELTPVVEEG